MAVSSLSGCWIRQPLTGVMERESPFHGCLDVHPEVGLRLRDVRKGSGEEGEDSNVPVDGPTAMPPTSSWTV